MILSKMIEIFRTERAAPLLSFIVGLGVVVMMFHRPFLTRPTLSLPLADIEGQVIKQGSKCFEYHAEDTQCEILPSK
jgi:hypothetical protein